MKNKENLSELWNACVSVLSTEKKDLEIWRIAQATKKTEKEIISQLIKEACNGHTITFRYPPLPRAAIVEMK